MKCPSLSVTKMPSDACSMSSRYFTSLSRRAAEAALRESEVKYRELIEQASDGIFVTDKEGHFILANSRYCEMLGYSRDEVLRLHSEATYPEDEREKRAQH